MPSPNDKHQRQNWAPVVAAAAAFLTASLVLGVLSEGVHHDDDLTHFLMARWSWWFPGYLVHVWGRPGFTAPMALVAWIGDREFAWHLARALSAVVTLAGALLATGLAKRLCLRRWRWTIALCYLQPLNMLISYTTLTENFTALYLIAALYLLHQQRVLVASGVFSLVLVSRLETVILLPIWAVFCCRTVRDRSNPWGRAVGVGAVALWAPLVQNVAHFAAFGTWPASVFLRPSGSTEYLAAGPLAYIPPLLLAATPAVILLAAIGVGRTARRGGWRLVSIAGCYLAVHWLIKWFGVFASGGYARFVVAVAPLLAVMAAAGLEVVIDAWRDPRRWRWIGLATFGLLFVGWGSAVIELRMGTLDAPAPIWSVVQFGNGMVLPAIVVVAGLATLAGPRALRRFSPCLGLIAIIAISVSLCVVVIRPLRLKPEHVAAREISRDLLTTDAGRPVFATNPWIAWWCGHVEDPRAHKGPRLLSSTPVGTIFVWDSIYSGSDYHELAFDRYESDSAYRMLRAVIVSETGVAFRVLEKVRETPLEEAGSPYPTPLTLGRGERLGSVYELEQCGPADQGRRQTRGE